MGGGVCTFTPKDKENLINELNVQLETNMFCTIGARSKKDEVAIESFRGVGLYRPLISNEFNPLNKTAYNYSANYSIPVRGMAFENNIQTLYTFAKTEEKEVKPQKKSDEFDMGEIIKDTEEDRILNYRSIPREMALVPSSKAKSFWFKEINVFENIKNIFKNKKQIL